jgi:hypothetical protein
MMLVKEMGDVQESVDVLEELVEVHGDFAF